MTAAIDDAETESYKRWADDAFQQRHHANREHGAGMHNLRAPEPYRTPQREPRDSVRRLARYLKRHPPAERLANHRRRLEAELIEQLQRCSRE